MKWLAKFRRRPRVLPTFPARGVPRGSPREFFLAIFHANRLDLTLTALESVTAWWTNTVVIDNSETQEVVRLAPWVRTVVQVFTPPVPLTFSQSMELCRREAMEYEYPWYAVMHNDAEVVGTNTLADLEEQARAQFAGEGPRDAYGALFTNYDALVCFKTRAVRQVGRWDTQIPQYGAETDYYHRMRCAGWQIANAVNVPVTHKVSQTILSDPRRKWLHEQINNPLMNYYRIKWGGAPGQERFKLPWNGEVSL